jgi:hypothetical protein
VAADVLVLRSKRESRASERLLDEAEVRRKRLLRIAEDIRRMTTIYKERLDGRRHD